MLHAREPTWRVAVVFARGFFGLERLQDGAGMPPRRFERLQEAVETSLEASKTSQEAQKARKRPGERPQEASREASYVESHELLCVFPVVLASVTSRPNVALRGLQSA